MQKLNIFWFRRDLRLFDNHGLYRALASGLPVLPVFIFDRDILSKLRPDDSRVGFIWETISAVKKQLEDVGSSLMIAHGSPLGAFEKLLENFEVDTVFANVDYEPYAMKRDEEAGCFLKSKGVGFLMFKDHVIFEKNEVAKDDGLPYTIFTPYSKKWKQRLPTEPLKRYPSEDFIPNFFKSGRLPLPSLESLGFRKPGIKIPSSKIDTEKIRDYSQTRDFPSVEGTTRLGIHLRFGTISIRELVNIAKQNSEVFLNELIWREFFASILWFFPRVENEPFKSGYKFIEWRNDEGDFERWCRGETGYPLVDAGMRELNETGFMHNRVRMVVASFLVKHLLIDWRWGEAYFAEKLLDFELASNNGNWQWAAGIGCDAAPYFRIFNPASQQQKFDKEKEYIVKWVPELNSKNYPLPIIGHAFARERAVSAYKKALLQGRRI
jgi:deoxyribodipyrimidine photo-lyase